MGRLTLNVLLSFAQFERELSSERVRDKVAASRRKGKWTGGTVPLGYDAKDKKLVINKAEAETVRYIFTRYLALQSFGKLVEDLDNKGIITKRRNTRVKKFNGGIPFTYGPLAHFLKNRLYIGETGHKDKWFPGEHAAIVDRKTFDQVQQLLASKSNGRKAKRSASEALLMGKVFDSNGNRMSPSFSTKNGVRYRFYISSALLRGRKDEVGSVGRVSATDIEETIRAALSLQQGQGPKGSNGRPDTLERVERVVVARDQLLINLTRSSDANEVDNGAISEITIPWPTKARDSTVAVEGETVGAHNEGLVQSVVRAHAWMQSLRDGMHESVERLAEANRLHPKVVRQALRLAFISPDITSDILEGRQPAGLSLSRIPKLLPLPWTEHRRLLG
jgi:site-specific DNA recombinase